VSVSPLPPGSTIGIVGGGQLGRMLSIAAARLGYRAHIYDPAEAPCAAEVAGRFTRGAYDDVASLRSIAAQCDVVTYEIENLPAAQLDALEDLVPSTRSLEVSQDRATEKQFIERAGGRPAAWVMVDSEAEAEAAADKLGLPFVLKTRRMGYDGKGQRWVREAGEAGSAFRDLGAPCVAEQSIAFDAVFSVIVARCADGPFATYDSPRNEHRDGILHRSSLPAGAAIDRHVEEARTVALAIAEALGHVGVLTVEFFATQGGPLVNEFAPRVHNSGHWTLDGAETSQFEQHLRCILGLPLGSTRRLAEHVSMENLIGSDVDRFGDLVAESGAIVHLYGKGDARPGRKMGHVTRLGAKG
jgi:5-(carboxyamino)imidazole ribonucleotide synthase